MLKTVDKSTIFFIMIVCGFLGVIWLSAVRCTPTRTKSRLLHPIETALGRVIDVRHSKEKKEVCTEMNLPIGENIKRLRIEAGLTQRALSYELGVSIQAVSKWEQNRSYPDLDLIPKIAQLLGVGIDALFESVESSAGENEKAM